MMRNDQLIFLQEHVANRDRFIQKAARVSAHIKNQAIQIADAQLFQRLFDFAIRRFVKRRQAHVADTGLQQKCNVNRVAGNFTTRDGEGERIRVAFARDHDLDDRSLGPFQQIGNFAGREPVGGFVIHLHDHVAWA